MKKATNINVEANTKYFLLVLILLISVSKLFLIGKGFLAFPDEIRYYSAGNFINEISEGHLKAALYAAFSVQGRPGEAIVKIIPTSLQILTGKLNQVDTYDPVNSYPLFIFNFVVYGLILLVHFKFSNLFLKDRKLSLLSVLIFASLTNSFIYLRHALPYDSSLLVLYYVIFCLCSSIEQKKATPARLFFYGIASFFGYLIYPGYILMISTSLILISIYDLSFKFLLKKIVLVISYASGLIFLFIAVEAASRFAGTSYIYGAKGLSSTITQGSFDESYTFLFKYLFEVEGFTGYILIGVIPIFYVASYYLHKNFPQFKLIIYLSFSLLISYILYASYGYFLHGVVFYGRLIHQFIPFICILAVVLFSTLSRIEKYVSYGIILVSILFVLNYAFNFLKFIPLGYPREINWEYVKKHKEARTLFACELNDRMYWDLIANGMSETDTSSIHQLENYNSVLVNGCFSEKIVGPSRFKPIEPGSSFTLISSTPHFLKHKAYQFEGLSVPDRKNMDQYDLRIKVFSRSKE